ncbi:MAG: hypothetical protein GVY06_01465 [Alphaproteobacteria bacterium]|jgi:hypothetical protein|nr:hypothetical protein [Alphaproteobacteria bacterium]
MDMHTVSQTPARRSHAFRLCEADEMRDCVSARYEYRAWFSCVPAAVASLHDHWEFTRAERRTDIYLLSPRQPLTLAKLRGGERLEVKRLLRWAGPHQIWAIRRHGPFPLARTDMTRFAELTGIKAPAPNLEGTDAESFLSSVMTLAARDAIEPVAVHKSRLLFTAGDCQAEITRVRSTGFQAITLAIEADDRMSADIAVRSLNLTEQPNMAYGEALRLGVLGENDMTIRPGGSGTRTRCLADKMKGADK